MPLKKSVDVFCRREEQRRNLAELRIAYGNALSDSNLGRIRPRSVTNVPKDCCSYQPIGQFANSYSWQLSNTCSGKLMQKVTAACPTHLPDKHGTVAKDSTTLRRYDALQRRARLHTTFIKHLDQVKFGKSDDPTKSSILKLSKFAVLE
ncbi:uncharacterized protein LOC117793773 [Drosophila innubila]|uniref:uncharacterized protein LOC117793773 n=1 Tax=Drosophila innubila TaxID=198719 RepID=UPI00148D9A78|nr:uncharacterized protein LOC117793773 [Drosophila innubila]